MRYIFALVVLLLLAGCSVAADPGAFDEPHEQAIVTGIISALTAITGLGGWMVRTWWKSRLYRDKFNEEEKEKLRVEKKLEREWTNGEDTLTGASNPGRTQAQLVEIVHEDLQTHKSETNRRFDLIHGDLGKIKGKLDIN